MKLPGEAIAHYLSGEGIEIGALHRKIKVPEGVKVYYVDRLSISELKKLYPELSDWDIVGPDIVDDGETLQSIPDESWDFVIASHMIEHCENPIGALENFLRVVKPGGVVYLAVPDKRYTFDRDRPITSLEHIVKDYREGSDWSRLSHYEEWVKLVEKVPTEEYFARVKQLYTTNHDIHVHSWTSTAFLEVLSYCQTTLCFSFEIELFQKHREEFLVILRKTAKHLRLDLGCGSNKKEGTIGVDIASSPGVDYILNIETDPLPFPDQSVEYIYSSHTLEHLSQPTPLSLFQEMSRVCVDGATLEIWVPYGWHNSAFIFGHRSFYNEDHYLHLCTWFGHLWAESLGARWFLKEITYIIDPAQLIEIYESKTPLDFAIKHYKNLVREFGVIIEVRHNYVGDTVQPNLAFATDRERQRHPLKFSSIGVNEEALAEAINWFSIS